MRWTKRSEQVDYSKQPARIPELGLPAHRPNQLPSPRSPAHRPSPPTADDVTRPHAIDSS